MSDQATRFPPFLPKDGPLFRLIFELTSNGAITERGITCDAMDRIRSLLGAPTWRCFHCDQTFDDPADAELHFGHSEHDKAACQVSIEHVRWLEAQHRRSCDDDSEALRTIQGLASEHERLRREAEELGYARGLRDAQRHPEDLGLCVKVQG